jgi:hypothetical protein
MALEKVRNSVYVLPGNLALLAKIINACESEYRFLRPARDGKNLSCIHVTQHEPLKDDQFTEKNYSNYIEKNSNKCLIELLEENEKPLEFKFSRDKIFSSLEALVKSFGIKFLLNFIPSTFESFTLPEEKLNEIEIQEIIQHINKYSVLANKSIQRSILQKEGEISFGVISHLKYLNNNVYFLRSTSDELALITKEQLLKLKTYHPAPALSEFLKPDLKRKFEENKDAEKDNLEEKELPAAKKPRTGDSPKKD